jgi:hypothetical protein
VLLIVAASMVRELFPTCALSLVTFEKPPFSSFRAVVLVASIATNMLARRMLTYRSADRLLLDDNSFECLLSLRPSAHKALNQTLLFGLLLSSVRIDWSARVEGNNILLLVAATSSLSQSR